MKTTGLLTILLSALVCISSADRAAGAMFGSGANTFNIDFVRVDNPGNPADLTGTPNPVGSVAKAYQIAKYEISTAMIDKANATVANGGGDLFLTRDNRGANQAATNLTWNEAARFVNYLNTSAGAPKAYKFALNPGDAGYISNTQANQNIVAWTGLDGAAFNAANPYRNALAIYWLPSIDEWYKAAYYDAAGGVYYDYATGSDTAPTQVDNGTVALTAVYGQPNGQGPADITNAGGLSPYGTMAQNGNVFEWTESDATAPNGPVTDVRAHRGGYWSSVSSHLVSTTQFTLAPTSGANFLGFRVATVPEPSTAMLIAMASLGLLWRRKVS